MRRVLQVLALAVAGFVVFELIRRWLAEGQPATVDRARRGLRSMPEPVGNVPGAAMTAGGEGATQRTLGADGSTVTERVGRGVVRRTHEQPDQAKQGA